MDRPALYSLRRPASGRSTMPTYEKSITIAAEPGRIFDFAKDPENMPKYLSTVKESHAQGETDPQGRGRVAMEGEADGHPYRADGWIRYKDGANEMTWGSDGEHRYKGTLRVEGGGGESRVTVVLDFEPNEGENERLAEQTGSRDAAIHEGLETSLRSLKNEVEGNGGKERGPADSDATVAPGH